MAEDRTEEPTEACLLTRKNNEGIMRRILSIAVGSLVAMTVILVAGIGAAGDHATQVRGASVNVLHLVLPAPERCGPIPAYSIGNMHTGSDTLGGSFSITETFCWDPSHPSGSLIFDYEGTLTYLLTGEEATIHVGEWVETRDANCIVAPEPLKFTLDDFTGEHAGGRFKGHLSYVNDLRSCSGLDVPSISSWRGVFTPNAPGQ